MAKKAEPIITQTEILAIAGESIRKTILNLREEAGRVAKVAETTTEKEAAIRFLQINQEQQEYHLERLRAVETLYHIQTGSWLGVLADLGEEVEDE